MIFAAVNNPFIQFPGGAKWSIGFLGIFHTAVASASIGFALIVTVLQIIGYMRRSSHYDLLAKRIQLWHVCIYNIGTINAIGLVFALSGLYPQFWSQIFVQFFWPMMVEELLFFMLATTITLHYFFWDTLWGHKKLHILLGSLLTPMFLLQFYIINGMGGFMLTPGVAENQVSQWSGTVGMLGWDKLAFYNPSFLMLTLHRTAANFAYGAFIVAGVCGIWIYRANDTQLQARHENGGRLAFNVGFICLLALPVIGFFYAWVLKYHAKEAYDNLMIGKGDIVAGGLDWWWLKQLIVAAMLGLSLVFCKRASKTQNEFAVPIPFVYAIGIFYFLFYLGMAIQMTWWFFWGSLSAAVLAGLWGIHLLNRCNNSGRGVFVLMGILSFFTVCLGGYVREAARPRFVSPAGEAKAGFNRIAPYDKVYLPQERADQLRINMVRGKPSYDIGPQTRFMPPALEAETAVDLVSYRCVSCHTLDRIQRYQRPDWDRVVGRMMAYGAKLSNREAAEVITYLETGDMQRDRAQDNE